MNKMFCLIITVFAYLLVTVNLHSQTPITKKQEVRVNTARNTTPVNGFRSNAANYEIVNLPQDGRTNLVKINGRDCNWNVIGYSLADYRGKVITIKFSADVMRMGAEGRLLWQINNEPDYPTVAVLENAVQGVWNRMIGSITITPTNKDPFVYLTTWENNAADTIYYFDNLNVTIISYTWDYTPASIIQTAGEAGSSNTRNIYVSQSYGSDNGNGTQARPFQKIAHAMHYAKPGDTVLVDSGTYYERFRIPSGSSGRHVTLTAMPNAEVIITPTIPITPQWRQYAKNIWVADISEYVSQMDTEFPQLFADRDSMVEARFPNMRPSMSGIMDYKRDAAQKGTNKNTVVASRNIPSDITGARVVIWPGEDGLSAWAAFVSPVKSVSGRTINLEKDLTMDSNSFTSTGGDSYTPHPGNPFFIVGALPLLDAPGEYFFDKQTNQLYFYPPWNGRPDARTLTMRHYNSTAVYAENTSFVNIKNITIYGGSIFMRNSRNNVIENCRINYAEHFQKSGWYLVPYDVPGAVVVTGSNNRISGCEFGPSAGSGITLAGDDNVFTNNIVHDSGYSGNDYAGVFVLQSTKRLEISHNTITNSADVHIYFEAGNYERCVVRNNHMENHAIYTSDAGAFYTSIHTHGGGTEIYNNFVVCGNKGDNGTMHKLRMGLYVDNHSSNFVVHHNIVICGGQGLCTNIPNQGTRFYNNTVINADVGINFYGFPVDNADASGITFNDNLFINIKGLDFTGYGTENGQQINYSGNFVNGTIPVTKRPEGRMTSSGNARGTVDTRYRPTGRTPDIGAIPRNGEMFPYGANWQLGVR